MTSIHVLRAFIEEQTPRQHGVPQVVSWSTNHPVYRTARGFGVCWPDHNGERCLMLCDIEPFHSPDVRAEQCMYIVDDGVSSLPYCVSRWCLHEGSEDVRPVDPGWLPHPTASTTARHRGAYRATSSVAPDHPYRRGGGVLSGHDLSPGLRRHGGMASCPGIRGEAVVERIRKGMIILTDTPLHTVRTTPRRGDLVRIAWGKHMDTVGRVTGRLDMPTGTTWTVTKPDGVVLGDYAAGDLVILTGGEH